jgi:rhodanese-related sulfurtransferase
MFGLNAAGAQHMPNDPPPDSNAPIEDGDASQPLASEISVHDTKGLLESGKSMILVDCREPREHSVCQIEGSVLIPMDELQERVNELEDFRDEHIVVHCHHGGRSLRVVNWLRNHGFEKAQNMTGGIDVWSQEIDPEVPRY